MMQFFLGSCGDLLLIPGRARAVREPGLFERKKLIEKLFQNCGKPSVFHFSKVVRLRVHLRPGRGPLALPGDIPGNVLRAHGVLHCTVQERVGLRTQREEAQ